MIWSLLIPYQGRSLLRPEGNSRPPEASCSVMALLPQSADTAVTVAATWFTVTVNCIWVVSTPPFCVPPSSITFKVMVAVPKVFAVGVKVNVPVEFGLV